jgi:hypothetical protein
MMPARARGTTTTRIATGTLLLAMAGALTGCAGFTGTGTAAGAAVPVGPAPVVAAVDPAEPCPFLTQAVATDLAGEQRITLVGSVNACSLSIGGQYIYQINVFPNDNDRFNTERDKLFRGAIPLPGVGDEAFFNDGTGITTIGARKGDSFFTVQLVPAVADPNGGAATAPVAAPADPDAEALEDADVNGNGVVDADLDGDGVIDDDADPDAIAAADADDDGNVDDGILAALAAADDADGAASTGPITDIGAAKARMTDVANAVADSL